MGKSAALIILSLFFATSLITPSERGATTRAQLSTAPVIETATMPRPGYPEPVVDPAFGTPFVRITDPGTAACRKSYCTHRYSSSQAWNADQSLLAIANGCGGLCFPDGHTYEPLFQRSVPNKCRATLEERHARYILSYA